MENHTNRVVLYHANCSDGFTAAWALWKFKKGFSSAEFIAENHKFTETTKLLKRPNINELEVMYIDICPPRAQLIEIHTAASSILVLDHHESAMRECKDLPYCTFDMDHSGAMMAWIWIKGPDAPKWAQRAAAIAESYSPALIRYVQDADLWQWKLGKAKEIVNVIHISEHTFENWTTLYHELEYKPNTIVLRGETIEDVYQRQITRLMGQVFECTIDTPDGPVACGAVNSPVHQSQLGNLIAEDYPVAVVYHWERTCYKVSLRSQNPATKYDINVSKIAGQFGGGGHAHAAGLRCDNILKVLNVS